MLINFFEAYMSEIYFVYGLSFFLMGFAISLQVRRNSSFTMARSLWILAVFGFLHGISEWFYFYVPYRAALSGPNVTYIFQLLELNFIGISFAFLLFFGIRLVDDVLVHRDLRKFLYLAIFLTALWFVYFTVYRILILQENTAYWFTLGDIYSRHFFGLPGGLLSAYAVYRQRDQVKLFGGRPGVILSLNILAVSFVIYALVAGAVVPPAPVFLAGVINTENFFLLTGIPSPVIRMVSCIIITVSMLRVLTLFQEEKSALIRKVVGENAVLMERERIKKDLHDGIIQSLYAVGLHLKEVEYLHQNKAYQEADKKINSIIEEYDHVISDLRMYIQDLKRVELAGLDLRQLIEEVASIFSSSNLHMTVSEGLKSRHLSPETKVQLFHILRELLTNAVKYSGAGRIELQAYCRRRYLTVILLDDGRGFELKELKEKQDRREKLGLLHVRARVEAVKGSFQLISDKGRGTQAIITIPLEEDCTDDQGNDRGRSRSGSPGAQRPSE